ncbi:MAG: hypothetical protein RL189_675 [Pseudomonadota bacterium]|jgi:hypothetical protein
MSFIEEELFFLENKMCVEAVAFFYNHGQEAFIAVHIPPNEITVTVDKVFIIF